jgi:hypothetical protein
VAGGGEAVLTVETAPRELMPHALHVFLRAARLERRTRALHPNL